MKFKVNVEVEKFKTRLVSKGYSKKEGIDFYTFFPMVKMATVRIISLATVKHWHIH